MSGSTSGTDLERLLEVLRAAGVKRYSSGESGVEVEFFDREERGPMGVPIDPSLVDPRTEVGRRLSEEVNEYVQQRYAEIEESLEMEDPLDFDG